MDIIKDDASKVTRNMEVYHLYHTDYIIKEQTNNIPYTLEERELWINQTKEAIIWESTREEEQEKWTNKELKQLRATLYAKQGREEDKLQILEDLEDDIQYVKQSCENYSETS